MKLTFLYLFVSPVLGTINTAQAQVRAFSFAGNTILPGTSQSILLPVISGQCSTVLPADPL